MDTYIQIDGHIHTDIWTHKHRYRSIYTQIHGHIHTDTWTYTHRYMDIYTIHTDTWTYTHRYIGTYKQRYIYADTFINMNEFTMNKFEHPNTSLKV